MKKEIKFSISESLHTELQGIVEKKKIDENQIIEQIISDFITKQNVENDKNNVKSISWEDNSDRVFASCSWIKDSMKDALLSNDLFFIQIAYQRIFFVENFEFCFQLSMFRSCFKKEFKEFETHPRDTLLAQRFDPIFWSNFHASQISF